MQQIQMKPFQTKPWKPAGTNQLRELVAGVIRAALMTAALVSFAAPACDSGDDDDSDWVLDNGGNTGGNGSMAPGTDAGFDSDDDDNSGLDGSAGTTAATGGPGGDYSGADDDDDSTQAVGNTTAGGDAADTGSGTDGSDDTTGGDATDTTTTADTTDTGDTGDPDSLCLAEAQTFFMSADESNSQAAPVLMRSMVNGQTGYGYWGYSGMGRARPYEFLNYYDFAYPAPEKGLAPYAEALETKPGEYAIQIGLRSENRTRQAMRLSNITLVLDTSGSMSGEPLSRVIDSCRAIVGSLKRNDVISIVTWNTQTAIPLDSRRVGGPNDSVALAACNGLVSDGGTDLDAGLRKGYELAYRNYIPGAINRLVLMSDGGANVGETNPALIAQKAGGADEEGVFLAGVGMGASYDDTLMNTVTDYGRGAYLFIDSKAEADRMFGERFAEVFDVAALNVRVSATLPPGVTIKKFYGE
jgi:Ca-activated chloride channel homolog